MKSVLVTGASTGIGRASALRLDRAGWRVFAGVRRDEDAESLRAAASELLRPLMLDVTEGGAIAAVAARVGDELGGAGLEGLVNNAGIGIPSPLETLPIEDFRRQIEVNLTGQLAVTQAMLPLIRKAPGRIVFISSIGGRIAFPMGGAYHAAKFGIEAMGDVFRQELRRWRIGVSIVEPGTIDTEIWGRSEREAESVAGRAPTRDELYGEAVAAYGRVTRKLAANGIPPDEVAAAVERALTSRWPRPRYLVGRDARVQARLAPLIPTRLFDRIVARAVGL